MPGVVGMIRVDGQPATVTAALQKLHHFPTYRSEKICPSREVALGVVYCQGHARAFDWHFDPKSKIGVLISGTMLAADPMPHVLRASDVLNEYQTQEFKHWDRFEGGFLAIIVDLHQNRVLVANDRLGQLPLYYACRPGVFVFAPEAKGVLVNDGFDTRLSTAGIINFLSAGYCFGDLSLFDRVNVLEPSTLLSVNLMTLAIEKTRLWKMAFEVMPELNRRKAAEHFLAQSILSAHKTTLCDAPSRVAILLSGGWDSRGMLEASDQIHQPPHMALSWGVREDIAGSDVNIARRLADTFEVPFVFIPYTSDSFVENAPRWCYLSELATDNFGWCAQGAEALSDLDKGPIDVLLVGDEAWGRGGYVADEMEARAPIFAPRLPYGLRQLLCESFVEDAEEIYNQAILQISQSCEDTNFVDRKDFMYVHGRMARFLFPIRSQYRKEFALLLRRPFLSNAVLEAVRQLPPQYRNYRNLYISMLRRHFPRAMSVPVHSTASNPDWAFDIRQKEALRSYFLKLLDFDQLEQGPLGQLLDRYRFVQWRDDFFNAKVSPRSQQNTRLTHFENQMRVLTSRFPRTARMAHIIRSTINNRSGFTAENFDILYRIALLSLLQEHLSDFDHLSPS